MSIFFPPQEWPSCSSPVPFLSYVLVCHSSVCMCKKTHVQLSAKQTQHRVKGHTHTHIYGHSCSSSCRLLSALPCLTHFGCFWNRRRAFPACEGKTPLCCFCCHGKADQAKESWSTTSPFQFLLYQQHLWHLNNNSSDTDSSESWLMTHCCVLSTYCWINSRGAGQHSSQMGF